MAKRQMGGMQDVFVRLQAKNIAGVERAIREIEKAGGRVLHAPPSVLVASMPAGKTRTVKGKAGIVSVSAEPVKLGKAVGPVALAMRSWNQHFDAQRRLRAIKSPTLAKGWDSPRLLPPDPPAAVLEVLRRRDAAAMPARAAKRALGAPNMNIPVLVGRVAVGVIFVDSTVNQYAIADAEKFKVVSETVEGLNMLSGFEPRANVQWFYDFKRPKISLAAGQFTNANQNSWEDLWRDAAMGALGYSANLNGMNSYINSLKTRYKAQWAYALFVTKYPKFWFAYYWSNHVVMDFSVDGWGIDNFNLVVAHETGHVFGCGDEYASSNCICTSLHGRYQVANGNCENCNPASIPCLMKGNTPAVCDYTRGQLGWNELAVQSKAATTLKGTWTFDLDAGVQGPSGGADIWWEQVNNVIRFLVPQSGAMLAHMGKPNFDAVSLQTLKSQAYSATPIDGSNNTSNKLKPGTVIAVKTSAGRYAKIKIETYGYNLGIRWVTYK